MPQLSCPTCQQVLHISLSVLAEKEGRISCPYCRHLFNGNLRLREQSQKIREGQNQITPKPVYSPNQPSSSPDKKETSALTPHSLPRSALRNNPPPRNGVLSMSMVNPLEYPLLLAPAAARLQISLLSPAWRPWISWLTNVGVTIALLALCLQFLYIYRNEIAHRLPHTSPVLSRLCQSSLRCQITPPIIPGAISIENSSLEIENEPRQALSLLVLLRNRSVSAQSYPHLEFHLLDSEGQTMASRVLTPTDYLSADSSPLILANVELPIKVTLDTAGLKASGYRVQTFYP